jgi:hypothetical protein
MGKCCGKCKQIKPLTEFSKSKAKFDGHNCWCKSCMRTYTRRHYKENRATYIRKNKDHRKVAQQRLWEIKKSSKCCLCGENHPAVLDFHHLDASTKEVNIADCYWGLPRLLKEIQKCIIVCSNCHRKIHYNERTGIETQA